MCTGRGEEGILQPTRVTEASKRGVRMTKGWKLATTDARYILSQQSSEVAPSSVSEQIGNARVMCCGKEPFDSLISDSDNGGTVTMIMKVTECAPREVSSR